MRLRGHINPVLKPDGSFVTEADIQANALLLDALHALTPDIPILAEENPKAENDAILGHTDTYWTVDPLDVTGNYVQGGDGFSVNIALIRAHVPVLGVLIFPAKDECYYTGSDGHAYLRHAGEIRQLQLKTFDSEFIRLHPREILSIAMRERGNEDALEMKQNKIRTIVTTGQHRACMVARGDALMSSEAAGFRAWDSAPTFAILRAAGGELRQNDGQLLNFRDKLALPEYTVGHASLLDRILPHQTGQ
jgi:3'(2'), 5'-bisphosphate nucleotidase